MMNRPLWEDAMEARAAAYCPYSGYAVGAAILDDNGDVHTGCNVENASSPVGTCAEVNALAAMVRAGGRRILAVAVATEDGSPPCGSCLQALSEFVGVSQDVEVFLVDAAGNEKMYHFDQLLPYRFFKKKR